MKRFSYSYTGCLCDSEKDPGYTPVEPHLHSEDEYEKVREVINRMITDRVVLFSRKKVKTT